MKAVLVVVEAPGTAPGSNGFITLSIYYHSWQASTANIGKIALIEKGGDKLFRSPFQIVIQAFGKLVGLFNFNYSG